MNISEIEHHIAGATAAVVHEAEDEFSKAFGGHAMALVGSTVKAVHRIADALERLVAPDTLERAVARAEKV